MTIIGKENDLSKPVGYINGPGGKIDISGLSCVYSVGSIPVCRVFIPPEFLSDIPDDSSNDAYTVVVKDGENEHTLFKGYVAGDNGRITGNRVMAGVDLVHIARDLDEARISAPSLHPGSMIDYTYTLLPNGDFGEAGFSFDPVTFYKPGSGKLPEQIVKALMEEMKGLQSEHSGDGGENVETESLQRGIDLLGKIKFLDGKLIGSIESPLSSDEDNSGNSINSWCRQRCTQSFNSARSVWDTLCSVFSEFGIYLVCDNNGEVFTAVDCSGMKAAENKLGGDYITTYDKTSAIFRNIGKVALATENVRADSFSAEGGPGGFVTYNGDKPGGGTLVLQMPGWLNPIVEVNSEDLAKVQYEYAKSLYFLEKNKFRTLSITGPLAPLAIPGTIIEAAPYSAMKARSGGQIDDFQKKYNGYCYQVVHEADCQSRVLQTTFYLKNVSIVGSGDEMTSHPLFDDVKPFPLK